ncbi:UNVERIFIED_CONTAM: ubiI [Trichonephila clavipes]
MPDAAAGVRDFDVVVVGAGMVGSLFGLLLLNDARAAGLRLAIVDGERSTLPAPDAPFDLRVSALSRASEDLLARAGCGDALAAQRHCLFTDMRVWEADGTGAVHFRAGEVGETHLGMLVENRIVQAVLADALFAHPQVAAFCPVRVQHIARLAAAGAAARSPAAPGWQLTLSDGSTLRTSLLIGADGAASRVRDAAGIGSATWDYRQKGLVCTVATVAQHRHTAWQRFLPEGPLAFLPLADLHQCSIVWTLPSDRADAMLALPEDAFRRALGQAFEHRLGDITTVGPRGAFPLQARHAEHYEQDGLALIGDAAHSIHPLAGQGVNLGMLDAALLADELLTQRAAGLPLHHGRALRRYSRGRRGHNAALMHGMTGFERLFAADAPALRLLRNTGMSLFDRGGLLKHWVMRVAVLGRGGL